MDTVDFVIGNTAQIVVALDHWDANVDMHRAYIDAGAYVITVNTYASSRPMLEPAGFGSKVEKSTAEAPMRL
ncbi:MAG: homocysteine S-methyltransferase family protein [Hyphomicrobiaceae bacterium]